MSIISMNKRSAPNTQYKNSCGSLVCEGLVPALAFLAVDTNALRKPNRFILSTVNAHYKKDNG